MDSIPFDVWQTVGLTEHMGGSAATRRLLQRCAPQPGLLLLDVGCGTGNSACLAARGSGCRVVALDLGVRNVVSAQRRAAREGLAGRVSVVRADVHYLPFTPAVFDGALAESVLAFCDIPRALAEIFRVVKPGGFFAANELTLRAPPPDDLQTLLAEILDMRGRQEGEWLALFEAAGFAGLEAEVRSFRFSEQLISHLQVDGWRNYLVSVVAGLRKSRLRRAFLNRRMLSAARRYLPLVGYGLYTGRKPYAHRPAE